MMKKLVYNSENLSEQEIDEVVTRVKVFLVNENNELLIATSGGGCQLPGGHREENETILETAKRELNEETGAVDFSIVPVCVYSVTGKNKVNESGAETYGMLFFADIKIFENELHSEIEKVLITDTLVDNWTYPLIQPKLIEEAKRRGLI